ncbi:MAG: 4Fe-4S dicluster domain-containing protein [bacterium]|nr:4Fe-4S dicluster domain-containing protein [bacterium]
MIRWPQRSGTRLFVFAVLVVYAVLWPAALRYALPALSPFLWVCSVVAARTFSVALLVTGLPVAVLAAWRRRWFCRTLCPMGWTVELCANARTSADCGYPRVPRIGQALALLTLGGAAFSIPLFLLFDPVALFAGVAGLPHAPLSLSQAVYAAGFGLIVALSLAFPLLWCKRLCPLGATQDLIADACSLFRSRGVEKNPANQPVRGMPLARRAFAGVGVGAVASMAFDKLPRAAAATPLRPPGTVDETTLATLCVRCGNCVRSCPTSIIQPDLRPSDVTAILTPIIRFDGNHCLETCRACGTNCPTGAIAALPLAEKNARKIGLATIDEDACLLALERDCSACAIICPHGAVTEEFSKETYTTMVRIDADACNGCGACIDVCPPVAIQVS